MTQGGSKCAAVLYEQGCFSYKYGFVVLVSIIILLINTHGYSFSYDVLPFKTRWGMPHFLQIRKSCARDRDVH